MQLEAGPGLVCNPAPHDTVEPHTCAREGSIYMFLLLFVLLLIGWLLGWVAFHVASFGIHVLLILAVIALILHFVRGGRTTSV
jgi:hypothetical protein